jgi:hypothetical protein
MTTSIGKAEGSKKDKDTKRVHDNEAEIGLTVML